MSDRTLAAFHRDSRTAVDQNTTACQLHDWMIRGEYADVAAQLIPWVVGDHCLGAVRNSFLRGNGGAELEYDDMHAQAMLLLMELLHKWKPGGMTVMSWAATYVKQGLYRYCITTLRGDSMASYDGAFTDDDMAGNDGDDEVCHRGSEHLTADLTPLTDRLCELDELRLFIMVRNLGLTTKQKAAFDMYYKQGLSMTDIGVVMNVSKQTVQENISGTLSKLRVALSYT